MKTLQLHIPVKVFAYEELAEADRQLIDAAREATYHSYAPPPTTAMPPTHTST